MPSGFEGMNFGGMGGMPGGGSSRSFHFSTGGGAGGFNFSDPSSIFAEFFRQGGAGMGDDEDVMNQFSTSSRHGGRPSRHDSYGGPSSRRRAPSPEVTTVERPLPVTLEELFRGTHKRMKIKRKRFDRSGNRNVEEKVLEMDVKPGYKAGTKIKFKGVGDQQEDGGTQDLHFIVTEVRFDRFLPPFSPNARHFNLPFSKLTSLLTNYDTRNHIQTSYGKTIIYAPASICLSKRP